MTVIKCRECRKTCAPEEVIEEGRGSDLTCPFCGMSESLYLVFDSEVIDEVKREMAMREKEFKDE